MDLLKLFAPVMLPEYPAFETLSIEHLPEIEKIAAQFPPFSDFNPTSLFCWNTNGRVACALLNNNLVIQFSDYLTGEPFYMFLGTEKTNETAHALLSRMASEGHLPELKLIPHASATTLDPERFHVSEDEDNFDYILPIDRLITYAGNQLGPKRNFVNRFKKLYTWDTRLLDLTDPATQHTVVDMFHGWASRKGVPPADVENEFKALSRIFALAPTKPFIAVGIYINGALAGFTLNERVSADHAILHFEKADADAYIGIYQMLMAETARILSEQGCRFLNYEQDLGIPGLKKAKKSFAPSSFLQKYRVTWREKH